MTNSAYAKNNGDGLLCSILCHSDGRNRWEICLRMRYNLRGLRERDLGRVNIVI